MITKFLFLVGLFSGVLIYSQTEIYFKYDEAGNQRYRGIDANGRPAPETPQTPETLPTTRHTEEDIFWAKVGVYPVPVKDILTIQWDAANDELIDTVSMYQYGIIGWNFQQKNMPGLNRQIQINMTGYYMGVYVLAFTLKNGKVYTRNIIKE